MRKLTLFCTLFLLSLAVYSEAKILSIDIQGLDRTTDETVYRILKVRPGDSWQEGQEEVLEQRLMQSGIFQSEIGIQVSQVPQGVELLIHLKDKWTLLVIPFFSASNGDTQGGAFALDSNFLGRQHMLMVSGLYSEDKKMFFMFYDIPKIKGSQFSLFQSVVWTDSTISLTDAEDQDKLGNYDMTLLGLSVRGGYEFNDELSLTLQTGIYRKNIQDVSPQLDLDTGDSVFVIPGLKLEYSDMYVYPLFSKGMKFDLESSFHLDGGTPAFSQGASALFSLVPMEWAQVQLFGEGYFTQGDLDSYMLLGRHRGSYTLPDDRIAADTYLVSEAAMEFRIIPLPFGSITMPVFFEAGVFSGLEGDQISFYGVGGGIRLYVDKVAIPAVGLEYHHNLSGAGGNVAFSIGMAF